MNWKKLPCWLKGGIIASGIEVILFVVEMNLSVQSEIAYYFANVNSFPAIPLIFILSFIPIPFEPYFLIAYAFLVYIISYFIIGALIGLVVSKIKSKK